MPANLPPQYYEAERRYRQAKTPEDKIEALEVMLAIMPRHKGTDHLHGDLRRRIAKLTEEAERKAATSRASFYIKKEGAGQVALIGLPNAGKSQLLAAVTDALPEIGAYPFTTHTPARPCRHPGVLLHRRRCLLRFSRDQQAVRLHQPEVQDARGD